MKTIKEKNLIPGEIYDDGNEVQLEFVRFEEDTEGKPCTTLFKPVDKTSKRYVLRSEDGLLDFSYRENELWYQSE